MSGPLRVDVNWPKSIGFDRAPVRFQLYDCFRMGMAVGAGVCCGTLGTAGVVSIVYQLIKLAGL